MEFIEYFLVFDFGFVISRFLNDGEKIFTRDFDEDTHYSGLIADMIRSLSLLINELN